MGMPAAQRAVGVSEAQARSEAQVRSEAQARGPARPRSPLPAVAVIVAATGLALALRLIQLLRPGYLTGFIQYDDGVYIGNSLRLVNGVIPYRDFAMVQPPGSMLLMAPAALLGKAFGSAWALAAARVLTVAADTANAALAGLLVRHRGPLAAGLASGGYAVYPPALAASQSLFLEPWLVLFCLLGGLVLFQGDQVAGRRDTNGGNVSTLVLAGTCFGFAAAVKIWALGPALVAALVCLSRPGRGPRALSFWGGCVAGLVVPCLPFLALAPRGFARTVFVSELVQATHGRFGLVPRLADITGAAGLTSFGVHPHPWLDITVAAVIVVLVGAAWLGVRRGPRPAALDAYLLAATALVVAMMFSPSEWYEHYAAFAGAFVLPLIAVSVARLAQVGRRPAWSRPASRRTTAAVLVLAIGAMAAAGIVSATRLRPPVSLAAAKALIPPGACVLTDTVSVTIAIDRFTADSPACPQIVDAVGTLISTTDGEEFNGSPAARRADTRMWRSAFSHAQYVWLIGNNGYTGPRILWTAALHAYFLQHFRLIAFPGAFRGKGNVPGGGLYLSR
jgi:alpha-1,2-mannosyltransferase